MMQKWLNITAVVDIPTNPQLSSIYPDEALSCIPAHHVHSHNSSVSQN